MSYDEQFVGSLAIILSIISVAIAVGPWTAPYRLRTFSALTNRFGKPVARGVWVAIALASLTAGIAILTGVRPSYADPTPQAIIDQ
ncbi:MAG: hypothetical protein P8L85_02895 [Rubripirellula sp.]|nr:hypothetical protein [Rubripirellula sp.]